MHEQPMQRSAYEVNVDLTTASCEALGGVIVWDSPWTCDGMSMGRHLKTKQLTCTTASRSWLEAA